MVKSLFANAGDVRDSDSILGQEDPLEEGMATHSSVLAWRIPWTEEPSGLQSIRITKSRTGLKRLRTHARMHRVHCRCVCEWGVCPVPH